ncbi:hypothetical protein A374_03094 [Fictibacillus macauensis ZFHKF-1]|uniref:Microcin J25-processing protein McjB C-terminal domain-containing protein n=1 Tax=Fictibacillus macauensis ZFHKF-1 TaxID=1196324 RepID=I8UI79_9BACL|nr:hypothetical protein A374_03094 [Fictibacillus macauensis ZFHKF-1]
MRKKVAALNKRHVWILVETLFYVGWSRLLLLRPFAKVAPSLGTQSRETMLGQPTATIIPTLETIASSLHIVNRWAPWNTKCLVRAIAGTKMLKRRGIESTLYLGTAKDEDGQLIAHAWLRSGNFILTGGDEMKKFTVVSKFANER